MKSEYDFSKGKRGRVARPNAELSLPIYLNTEVRAYFTQRAEQEGIPLSDMVNTLLKQIIHKLESAK